MYGVVRSINQSAAGSIPTLRRAGRFVLAALLAAAQVFAAQTACGATFARAASPVETIFEGIAQGAVTIDGKSHLLEHAYAAHRTGAGHEALAYEVVLSAALMSDLQIRAIEAGEAFKEERHFVGVVLDGDSTGSWEATFFEGGSRHKAIGVSPSYGKIVLEGGHLRGSVRASETSADGARAFEAAFDVTVSLRHPHVARLHQS